MSDADVKAGIAGATPEGEERQREADDGDGDDDADDQGQTRSQRDDIAAICGVGSGESGSLWSKDHMTG